MTKHLKPREQGDIGELSAMQWFAEQGAHVFVPLGHSPDVDLVAILGGRPLRVEVKTCGSRTGERWSVRLATAGGNQSWNRVTKRFDPARCDLLFVLVGGGRRWLIPTGALEGSVALSLGGPKYSEFEIDPDRPFEPDPAAGPLESAARSGEYPSGLRMAAVNRPALPSQVRILSPPSRVYDRVPGAPYERPSDSAPEPISFVRTIYGDRCMKLPGACLDRLGLSAGSKLRVEALADGCLLMTPIGGAPESAEAGGPSSRDGESWLRLPFDRDPA